MDYTDVPAVPFLRTHELHPENQETPIRFLREWITPEEYFFLRNHFPYPTLQHHQPTLQLAGEINQKITFHLENLKQMPSKTLVIPLECSGNKRSFFNPKVFGTQWEEGAISQGIWTGVPLQYLLTIAGLTDKAKEVVFEGYDHGTRADMPGEYSFARSLPVKTALHPDTLIAYELNGKPIPFKHGYPLRVIVPGWYGMAWVKWLKRITVISETFTGPFQSKDYNYYPDKKSDRGKHPVTVKNVNSTILSPLNLSELKQGLFVIDGIAWTGRGVVSEVEISTDNGSTWQKATMKRYPDQPYAWVYWYYSWNAFQKGEVIIVSRAKDSYGRIQPINPYWNRKGYGYNAVDKVKVKIE